MPCGGINKYTDVPPGDCFLCGISGADHYCSEWDCMLHANCIVPFLLGDEGSIVIEHGHEVMIWFTPEDAKTFAQQIKNFQAIWAERKKQEEGR